MHHMNLIHANILAWCSNKHNSNSSDSSDSSDTPLDVVVNQRNDKEIIRILEKYKKWKTIVSLIPEDMKENIQQFNKPDKHIESIIKHSNLEAMKNLMNLYPDINVTDDKISGIDKIVYVKNIFEYCSKDCVDKFDYLLNESILKDKLTFDQKNSMVKSFIENISSHEDLETIQSIVDQSITLSNYDINNILSKNHKLSCDSKIKIIKKIIDDKNFTIEESKYDLNFTEWQECPKISKYLLSSDKFKHVIDKRFDGLSSMNDIKEKYKEIRQEKLQQERLSQSTNNQNNQNNCNDYTDAYDSYQYYHSGITSSSKYKNDLKFCKFI
ncbi:hypothetical protein QJ850_gp915 [Acanthamoeba polyphaga mimivirus]|uniref:Uncharacterized protein n=1 Tax=Acanthamoeba polyphaga mimivirus Kroon TaxID=3069720 RepID=A0A0G2Y5D8_9VIRU|nr:hypothetical protein QJ850_gp915 [Acanthamoeba polyphaga mimivirus]AKI79784.1 hypothetical protein [Acanthamoeba polyphaga mimivirus Kroon]